MALGKRIAYKSALAQKNVTLTEFLDSWASEPAFNRNMAGRLVDVIGKPEIFDTSKDPVMGRVFGNQTIRRYPRLSHFRGIETAIENFMRNLESAAEHAEQARQIHYLVGPPGSGKSTFARCLKQFAQERPVYVLGVFDDKGTPIPSPVFESPLGLFNATDHGDMLENQFKIPRARLMSPMSSWAAAQLDTMNGELDSFIVVEVWPSMATSTLIAKVEPKDGSDVASLVGAAHKDTGGIYRYTGGLNRTTQGLLELPEIFKAGGAFLHPLLGATQDGEYEGDGAIGVLPYEGLIIAHSNEPEWSQFKIAAFSDGLISRIVPTPFPYTIRASEESKIYQQQIQASDLKGMHIVPGTLEMLAEFAELTRYVVGEDDDEDTRLIRLDVYDGKLIKDAPSVLALLESFGWRDGMSGESPRNMLKLLSNVAKLDPRETGIDLVSLYEALRRYIIREDLPDLGDRAVLDILEEDIFPRAMKIVERLIQVATFENYEATREDRFSAYVRYAEAWLKDGDYKEPGSDVIRNREWLTKSLLESETGIEMADGPRKFRQHVVLVAGRDEDDPGDMGKPQWTALEPHVWEQFEQNLLPTRDRMLLPIIDKQGKILAPPLISLEKRQDKLEQKKHDEFMARLCKLGCTPRQAYRILEWYLREGRVSE